MWLRKGHLKRQRETNKQRVATPAAKEATRARKATPAAKEATRARKAMPAALEANAKRKKSAYAPTAKKKKKKELVQYARAQRQDEVFSRVGTWRTAAKIIAESEHQHSLD